MSSLTGSFQSCTDGSHSGNITCSGSSCSKLSTIPGLSCTTSASGVTTCFSSGNTNGCSKNSNLTSSFALQGNGLTITQTHDITIGAQTYRLNGTGGNFTKATAGSKSSAYPTHRPGFKLLAFVGFLLFCSHAFAATSPQLQVIDQQYAASLGSVLDPLNTAICKASESGSATSTTQQIGIELDALTVCLEGLMNTLLGLDGSLIRNVTAFGESLPITDAGSLFAAAVADIFLCLTLTEAIWANPSKVTAICGPVLGNTPTVTTTPTQTTSGSSPIETSATTNIPFPVPGSGLPPNWPSAEAWTGSSYCMSCMFALVYLTSLNNSMEPYEPACDITNIPVSAADLSVWLCDPAYGTSDFTPMCNYLCAHPCQTWGANTIQSGLPDSLWTEVKTEMCFDACTANQTLNNDYGNYTCPGTELNALSTYDPYESCLCGTGFMMCLPVPYNLTLNGETRNHCTDEGGP